MKTASEARRNFAQVTIVLLGSKKVDRGLVSDSEKLERWSEQVRARILICRK